jgi:hypothetical protein
MRHAAAVAVLVLLTATAFAEPPGLAPAAEPPPASEASLVESYRAQTLMGDGVAVLASLLMTTSTNMQTQEALGTLAAGAYLFGAPAAHLLHHRPGRAIGSFVMRAGIPLVAALLLARGYHSSGAIGGGIVASVIDNAFLAKGDERPARMWSPTVAAIHGGVTLGVGGAF